MEEIFDMVKETPNDMELGKKIRKWYYTQKEKMDTKWIYESPDRGKTVTKRALGAPLSERILITDTKKFVNPYKVNEVIEDWYIRDET